MGVVNQKSKKKELKKQGKEIANGKPKVNNEKVKKKRVLSCLQCIKPNKKDGGLEGKYRVAAPELMQDTFMSDSEDEGGEVECPIQQQQQYRYMNSEAGTLHRAKPLEDSVTDGHLWPSNNDKKVATIDRQPLDIGFLVSFVVDARGGAMKAKRRGGVRIIVPPAACAAPTRVTCRAATRRAPAAAPPPLMEGEALASRLLELQPQGAKFLAPVIIEVPIFTASCREREIVILRSDTGETWQDHYLHNNDNPMIQETLQRERQEHGTTGETLGENGERVTRIVTCDFPHYLAVVSRVRQEVHIIGPEGGTVSSAHIPQVQALFPAAALTKRIRVGLQAHGASPELIARTLPRHAAVSPVITVEPRRRKFHRSITLTAPLPAVQGNHNDKQTTNLRLLCSIMGGQARAVWEDVTGSTPLTITGDCASFTTTVSARFWLMNCQNVSDATKLATELYRDMLVVPFEVRIVVLGKRLDALEGRLLVLYITDRYAYDTLLHQEHYTEVAHSTAVRLVDGRAAYLEFSGNLVPVTKSGSQPSLVFEAFKDNRVEFTVRVKHHEESPSGRIYFMNEPKVAKGEQSQTPACVLDVELPTRTAPRAAKSQVDYLNLDQSGFDALKDELSFNWGDHNHSINPPAPPPERQLNGHAKIITNGDVKYTDTNDKDTKPQLNGDDTLHVDSNKVKATFDSDEDKTPMNTLEKGKKKSEGGFLGGLTDKVKNVFKHDDSEEKESSPKPQPKPRDSKEKSPPKPAPRIINADLLGKVDDMFKDLKTKPHQRDDDEIQEQVYTTKLVVDEGDRPLSEVTEDLYEQYANMQPVETPLRQKVNDPFQFPKCCDGKNYKHSHEETSNVADIIEQANFTAHEKMNAAGDRLSSELHEGLAKIEEEKGNVTQTSNDIKSEVSQLSDKLSDDLIITEKTIKSEANDKLDDLFKSVNKIQDDLNAKKSKIQSYTATGFDDFKSSTGDVVDSFANTVSIGKDDLKSKANVMDFAARERAEQLYLGGQEVQTAVKSKANDVEENAKDIGNDIKNKTQDTAESVAATIHSVQEKIGHEAQDLKTEVKETADNIKDATSEKINEVSESIEKTKQKAKKEGKKKAKEGKNFFTGFVSNIFGEKDKLEEGVKGKIAKGKEAANDLVDEASSKKNKIEEDLVQKQSELKKGAQDLAQSVKDEQNKAGKAIEESVTKKEAELKQGTVNLVQNITDEKNKAEKAINDKAADVKNAVDSKKEEAQQAFEDKTQELKSAITNKTDEITTATQETAAKAQKELQKKKDLVVNFIETEKESVLDKTNEAKQIIVDKKNDLESAIVNKKDEIGTAISEKSDEAVKAVKDKKAEVDNTVQSTKDALVHTVQENTDKAKNALQDTRDSVESYAYSKADEFGNAIHDVKDQVGNFVQNKTELVGNTISDTRDNIATSFQEKSDEAKKTLQNKKEDVENAVLSKKDEVQNAINNKRDEVQNAAASELDRIRQEAEQTTEQIKKTAEEALNTASAKKDEVQTNISKKVGDIKQSTDDAISSVANKTAELKSTAADKVEGVKDATKEQLDSLQRAASDKAGGLQRSAQHTFDHVQDSTLSSFDKIESSAKDKVSDAKDTWEDLHSSTRDTYADMKDDVHSLGSSAQDTLHSFQSSAGNTFDSLDDSAREFIGGVQTSSLEIGDNSKELFGDVKDSFEGFQVSADNKLEDVKWSAQDQLDEAGARLGETADSFKVGARETEHAVASAVADEADKFTSSLNDLGNSVFGSSGKGFMKDSSTKLLESEKSQSSPSPHKKGSGIPKLRRKK